MSESHCCKPSRLTSKASSAAICFAALFVGPVPVPLTTPLTFYLLASRTYLGEESDLCTRRAIVQRGRVRWASLPS